MYSKSLLKLIFPFLNKKKNKKFIWERFDNREDYKLFQKERIARRVKNDLIKGELKKAISRLEGFLEYNSTDQEIHNDLGKLYYQINNKVKAGRHWYFKEKLQKEELESITSFKLSLGNCPLNILKKLFNKQHYKLNTLTPYTKEKYLVLIDEVELKFKITPKFVRHLKSYLQKDG